METFRNQTADALQILIPTSDQDTERPRDEAPTYSGPDMSYGIDTHVLAHLVAGALLI